jgi:WD40 repeat protein
MLLYEDHKAVVVYALAFSPDGTTLASGAKDGSVSLRDADGQVSWLRCDPGPKTPAIHALAFLPDGAVVIGHAYGWHIHHQDTKVPWQVNGPSSTPTNSLALLGPNTLAVGTGDRGKPSAGTLELWDLATGRRLEPYFQEPNGVRAVAVCPARNLVAWATGHRKVNVWDIRKQKPLEFPQPGDCYSIALDSEGTRLAVALDRPVRLYDVEKRRERAILKGHTGRVEAVAFSPDGSTVATGSWDHTVRLWDVATGKERANYKWPIGRVYSLAYAPDGLRLAAGGDLGAVVVWDVE